MGLLPLLGNLPYEMLTPPVFKKEVVDKGQKKAAKDAIVIEKALRDGIVRIEKVSDETLLKSLLRVPEIHRADAEVLVMTKQVGGIAIVDNRVAHDMARIYRIKHGGTAFSLAFLIVHNLITEEEARIALDDMIRFGWRCSAEKYSKIIRMIEEF